MADPPKLGDAHVLARRLAALPDRRMRSARLLGFLQRSDPTDAAWVLEIFATAGRGGGPPYDLSLLAAVDLAGSDALPYALRRELFEIARAHQLQGCTELLLSDSDVADEDVSEPRPLVPGSRPLTLGERKSLARSWDRQTLERLIEDPHTDVVELLLANPHVTETDILRIATSRRSSAAVLLLVLRARKWGGQPRIRRALMRNPGLPLATSLRLVGLLNRSEQRELANDPSLPASLLEALRRRLRPPE